MTNQDYYEDLMRNHSLNTGLNVAHNLGADGSLGFFLGNILGGSLGNYLFNKDQNKIDGANNPPNPQPVNPNPQNNAVVQALKNPNYLSDQFAAQLPYKLPTSNPFNLANDFSGGAFSKNPTPNNQPQYPQANLFNEIGSAFQNQKPARSMSDPNYLSNQFTKQVPYTPPTSYNFNKDFTPYLSIRR